LNIQSGFCRAGDWIIKIQSAIIKSKMKNPMPEKRDCRMYGSLQCHYKEIIVASDLGLVQVSPYYWDRKVYQWDLGYNPQPDIFAAFLQQNSY
jgi:hypothetical protein